MKRQNSHSATDKADYFEKLRDPRWQKMRLDVLSRDSFTCQECDATNKTLHVHHCFYIWGRDPWEYPLGSLLTLCEECHEYESAIYGNHWANDPFLHDLAEIGLTLGDIEALSYSFASGGSFARERKPFIALLSCLFGDERFYNEALKLRRDFYGQS